MTKPPATGSTHIQQQAPVPREPAAGPDSRSASPSNPVAAQPQGMRGAWLAFVVWAILFVVLCLQAFLDLIIGLFR